MRFTQTGGELTLCGNAGGFQLAGSDGKFHNAAAELLSPDTVRLTCPEVPDPVAVRYAWENFCRADLHGGTGLAAASFLNTKGE